MSQVFVQMLDRKSLQNSSMWSFWLCVVCFSLLSVQKSHDLRLSQSSPKTCFMYFCGYAALFFGNIFIESVNTELMWLARKLQFCLNLPKDILPETLIVCRWSVFLSAAQCSMETDGAIRHWCSFTLNFGQPVSLRTLSFILCLPVLCFCGKVPAN